GRGALDSVGHEHPAGNGASCDRQAGQRFRNDPVPLQGGKDVGRMERLEHALGAEAGRPTVPSQRTYGPRAEISNPRSNQPINLARSIIWSGRADLNRGPPAPKAVNEYLSCWPV